ERRSIESVPTRRSSDLLRVGLKPDRFGAGRNSFRLHSSRAEARPTTSSRGLRDRLLGAELRGQPDEVFAEHGTEAFVLQTELDGRLKISELAAAIVTLAFELVCIDRLVMG